MSGQRFRPPLRGQVDPGCWESPIFGGLLRYGDWLRGVHWPSLAELDRALAGRTHAVSGLPLHLVNQDAALLADGLHFEQRSFERGQIAMRSESWHDLFNALLWMTQPRIKAAINARQAADVAAVGSKQRTRAQCALTHFDEAGAVVVLSDPAMLACWDAHDWAGLFLRHANAWRDGRAWVEIIGHALLESALLPDRLHTAKCLVVLQPQPVDVARAIGRIADGIGDARLLTDPQELRPLPVSGIPGWHPVGQPDEFILQGACFRPLRPGRTYPPAVTDPERRGAALQSPEPSGFEAA